MQRIIALLIAVIFLSGCALSTIRPPKRKYSQPSDTSTHKRTSYAPKPVTKTTVTEEITPAKEEILPLKEEILPLGGSDVK
jgi:hypothetical protein